MSRAAPFRARQGIMEGTRGNPGRKGRSTVRCATERKASEDPLHSLVVGVVRPTRCLGRAYPALFDAQQASAPGCGSPGVCTAERRFIPELDVLPSSFLSAL